MGVSPASIEGFKTIKGEESIQALLDQTGTTTTPSAKVETTLETQEGTAGEIAQKAADIQSSLNLTDMSEKEKIDFLDSVIEGKPASEKLIDREGNPVEFTSAETPEDIASQAAAAQKMKDDIVREAEERRESAKKTGAEKLQAAKDAAAAYQINTEGKSVEQIQNEIQAEQKARADAARERLEQARSTESYRQAQDDGFGGTGYSSGTSFGGTGYETSTGEAMVAKGGLMDKDKLAKQMKQSGLASKK